MRRKTHLQVVEKSGYKASIDDLSSITADLAPIENFLAGLSKETGSRSLTLSQSDCAHLVKMLAASVNVSRRVCHEYNQLAAEHENACGYIGALKRWINTLTENDQQTGNDLIDNIEVCLDKTVAAQNGRRRRGDGHHLVWFRMNLLDEYIQNNDLLHDLTLLNPQMFDYIVHKVKEYMKANGGKLYYDLESRKSDPGNRSKLSIPHAVFMDFFMKRTNAPPAVVGALFGMNRTAVTRQCKFLDGVLEAVLPCAKTMRKKLRAIKISKEFLEFTGEGIQIDGTLVPAQKSHDKDNPETSGYSGKHKLNGFNLGVAITNTSLLIHLDVGPGNEHDYHMLKNNPLDLGLFTMSKKLESGGESCGDNTKDAASTVDTSKKLESGGESCGDNTKDAASTVDTSKKLESGGESCGDNTKDAASTVDISKEILIEEKIKVMKQVCVYCDKAYTGMKKDFKSVKSKVMHKGKNKKSLKEIKETFKTGDDAKMAKALGLTPEQYAENKEISSIRSLIERMIGRLKRWGVLCGPFYGTASDLKQQAEIISGVVNMETLWADIERDEAPLLAMLAKKRAKYTKSR